MQGILIHHKYDKTVKLHDYYSLKLNSGFYKFK